MSLDYDAVWYEGEVYCVGCLPECIAPDDILVTPILEEDMVVFTPVCVECQQSHTYMDVKEDY